MMHKLIRVIYGVLKSGKPFDPDKLLPHQADRTAQNQPNLALAS